MSMKKKIAIITGATGGIGKEFVKQLLNLVDEVWAVARNEKKLLLLQQEFGEKIIIISSDLAKIEGINKVCYKLNEETEVRYLVNNAGIARMASYKDFTTEEICQTVDLNCRLPVVLSNLCIPYMKKGSKILNISSASAFQPNPYINLYAASKAFEMNYARALNVELKDTGIHCMAVCPGWVDTELLIREINGKKVEFPGIISAKRVVTEAIRDADKGKDISIPSLYVKCQYLMVKILPVKMVMRLWMKGIKDYVEFI